MFGNESAQDLLARCVTSRQGGADFPTIWNDILRRHSLVLGLPIQVTVGSESALQIQLTNGQRLRFVNGAFDLG